MKCLVTGAGGFIGGYLVEELLDRDCVVHAADPIEGRVCSAIQSGNFHFHDLDLTDGEATKALVKEIMPDVVYHLAAQSYPGLSWDEPVATFEINVLGTVHLLDAIREAEIKPPILVVCSSAEYAARTSAEPIAEDTHLDPSSPYGISKLAQDHVARLYCERYELPIVRARPFYLVGPRKTGDVCSDFARGIVAIERGEAEEVAVGNLDVVRDQLDVRDGVKALCVLTEQGEAGEVYNVCAGQGYRIGDILERLKAMAKADVAERVDLARLRPIDEMVKIGDATRLKALGWKPTIVIEQTLKDILEYWRGAET